ncbi:F-box/FBD/LRR-repeat protein At1g13570-like isoform X2 [Triticum urartu]|uniref:F-box/FBD/LRR-repeat protein At1g13570-like isoform X2 n=1 Tax=Triticum urartu TaxID=4572 RepID=UPI002043AFF9|nr:F-box/FBD/LRR-repeat protein At1g13570-like isoform X2 [Triticum urartu]XP_048552294.1 F-box/FBD/LRR-repeat protein At1g13570-like isoform X2 [Triticum urartu]
MMLDASRADGWNASSLSKRNSPACQQDHSHGGKKARYLGPDLPEDIWCHIHSLLPMKDAARTACVSHSFLCSWRSHPNLTLTNETMCPKTNLKTVGPNVITDHNNKIGRVLMNHSGAGVKTFRLEYFVPCDAESYHCLDNWLQIAVTPMIEELDLVVWPKEATFSSQKRKEAAMFNFPCTLLSDMCRDSIWNLRLVNCALHPSFQLGFRSLKRLDLHNVHITGDELGSLLSSSFALEWLKLVYCDDIVRLEIPCLLQRFRFLEVFACSGLEVIENKAPNISRFWFTGKEVQIALGESLKVKNLKLDHSCSISYAINTLPSSVPNLEKLTINSGREVVNAPMAPIKFLHLKVLSINFFGSYFHRDYDYLSFVSFFDASPSLETFRLYVGRQSTYDSFEGDSSSLRRITERCHGKLKSVKITGFCPQKSMLELTCHILENAVSLRHLTLDASPVNYRCFGNISRGKCFPMETTYIREAHKSILAVRTYIEGRVPSKVKFNVLEPCSRCHAL